MVDYLLGIIIALIFFIFYQSYMQYKERKDLYSKLHQYREVKVEEIFDTKKREKPMNLFKRKMMEQRKPIE